MSLRVWLPFNKDLNNQGLDGLLFDNYNVTLNDSGKIGKCALFNGTSSYIQFTNWTINNNPQLSICFWVNSNRGNLYGVFTSRASNTVQQLSLTDIGLSFRDTNHSSYTALSFTQPTVGIWTHYALIYYNGNWIIYKDGIEILNKTYSTATLNVISDIKIGRYLSSSDDVYFDGKLNDFRIYDHALSPAEVKEISRGLVLHYKLDDNHQTLDNCYDYPTFNKSTANGGWSHWAPSGSSGTYSQNTDREYIFNRNQTYSHKVSCTEGSAYYICYQSPAFEGGYRSAQAIIKLPDGEIPDTSKINWSGNALVIAPTTKFTYLRDGFYLMQAEGFNQNGTNDLVSIVLHSGITVYISEAYLENDKKVCSDLFNQNSNTVQDSSGYNNHGTITGELSLNSESPRYKNSTIFNGSSYIQIISPSSEVKSISLWAKWNSIPSGQSVVFVDYKSKIGLGLMSTGILCSTHNLNTKTFNKSNIVANTWYHFVIVNPDNTNRDLYINGVKQTPTTNTSCWTYTLDYFQLGKRSTTSDGFNGEISDFRMYSTILSEEDVRQLYEVSGKIDNKNNVHGFELIENNKKSIEKTGNINFDFEERDTNVFIYKQVNLNLLQGTVINSLRFERTSGMGTEFGKRFIPISQLQVNTYYTFSAMIRGNANINIYTINTGGNQAFTYVNKEDLDEKEFKLFSLTFRVTGNKVIQEIYLCSRYGEANTLVGDWYEIQENSIKLEEGEMCTPWVPAQTDNYYRNYDNMLTAKQFIEI